MVIRSNYLKFISEKWCDLGQIGMEIVLVGGKPVRDHAFLSALMTPSVCSGFNFYKFSRKKMYVL